ncbi:hypothetical protein D9M70_412180 [compost metagenome]
MGLEQLILSSDRLDGSQGLGFALPCRQVEHAGALDALWNDAGNQRCQGVMAGQRQHGGDIRLTWADMPSDKLVARSQGKMCLAHGIPRLRRFRQGSCRRQTDPSVPPVLQDFPDESGKTNLLPGETH